MERNRPISGSKANGFTKTLLCISNTLHSRRPARPGRVPLSMQLIVTPQIEFCNQ